MERFEGKLYKKLALLILTLALSMSVFSATVWAAPRMSKTKLTLLKGQSYTLKVKKAEGTVKWSSKKTNIATVTKKGKVKAKKKGTVYIIAKADGARLKCKVTVEDPKLNKAKASLDAGKTLALQLKGTKQKISWKSSDKKVATVTSKGLVKGVAAGTAKITATVLKKKFTCTVTVNKPQDSSQGTAAPTEQTPGTEAQAGDTPAETPAASGFDFAKDCKVTTGKKTIYIEFEINKETTTEEELKNSGYTIKNGKASKNTECETATYVFTNLPQNLEDIKSFPLTTKFDPVAAAICALTTADDAYYDATKYMYTHPVFDMMDYLNGAKLKITNPAKSGIFLSMRDTLKAGKMAYFEGAEPSNAYTPTKPYTFTLVHGPYYIPSRVNSVTGETEPERHMILISFKGDDEQRYVDVFHSGDGNWYTWDNSWQHLVASMKPVSTGSW